MGRSVEPVKAPYTGETIALMSSATSQELDQAIESSKAAFHKMKHMPRHTRHNILTRISQIMQSKRQALAEELTVSCGKPITQSLGEVDRAILTFSLAADECRRFGGEYVPLDVDARAEGMTGMVQRFPIGPISAITPFNFPLNLLCHKVAPAIAVGSTSVVKPPPQCPQLAYTLAEICAQAGLPAGAVNVMHMDIPVAERLATDPRFGLLTFTGSAAVGWHLKNISGKKKVTLELGGNAAVVVHEDFKDLNWLANRLAFGAFAYAGQVCIKVQRVLVHSAIYDTFVKLFVTASANLQCGNPNDSKTVVGPLIDGKSADRVQQWTDEALRMPGVKALLKGKREGNVITPTVLENVPMAAKVYCQEVFGPVTVVSKYDKFESALEEVNNSPYGLQAGVFTHDAKRIFQSFHALEVGGVIANDFPTLRVDNFPYGGVKDSGFGREGVKYAMEEMTEPRMLVINHNK
jgi:glyceraldehyde-3-phosphate dehydrogenase (NADP+)